MFKKILYPINFGYSKVALGYVSRLSKIHQANLFLLHAYRLAPANRKSDNLIQVKNEQEESIRRDFDLHLREVLTQARVSYTLLIEIGFLSDRLLSVANHKQIDLLVMNSQLKNLMQGDFAGGYEELINNICCPVMFIPDKEKIRPAWLSGN